MKGTNSIPSVVSDAQNKIKRILKHIGIKIKDVANETNTPYSTANEILNAPGRLNIPWLVWYADRFGTTTDYLLSR
jgi:predicted transcriptional regulator